MEWTKNLIYLWGILTNLQSIGYNDFDHRYLIMCIMNINLNITNNILLYN